jgi:hypothetical protein
VDRPDPVGDLLEADGMLLERVGDEEQAPLSVLRAIQRFSRCYTPRRGLSPGRYAARAWSVTVRWVEGDSEVA